MARMNYRIGTVIILAAAAFAFPPRTAAQGGSIEFVARATPSGGLEEPVRGFPFYLLSKSFENINKEVDASIPQTDMDAFIDKLVVSAELKTWMKKNHWVTLTGSDFIQKLKVADVMSVPEFYKAYLERNQGDESTNFPKPRYKTSDQVKDPAKFQKMVEEYRETVRKFMEQNPQTIDGIDLGLDDINPGPKWSAIEAKRDPEVRRRALNLAQSKYLIARTETNLQGEGFLRNVAPGTYWLSTLDVAADVGDVRPRWDVAVTVRPGETQYVALSNGNAVQSSHSSP